MWERKNMRIVSEKRIREFILDAPRSADVMKRWVQTMRSSVWRNPAELKAAFPSVSIVGDLTVFNIGGNKYRLAAFVQFRSRIVYVKRIGTHQEYDQWEL